MITNLFSIFDPSLSLFSFSWLTCLFVLLLIPSLYWVRGLVSVLFSLGFSSFQKEVDHSLSFTVKGSYLFIRSVFLVVGLFNFLALFPHIFSVTSHMLVTLPYSFSFWLAIIFFRWFNQLKSFLSHLIPTGTPLALISFMVLVEVVRNFIRPLALTFRLTANMMAGHLLMSLIGGALLTMPFRVILLGSSLEILLVVMELGVSVIQAYVFSTLLLLYMSEVHHS